MFQPGQTIWMVSRGQWVEGVAVRQMPRWPSWWYCQQGERQGRRELKDMAPRDPAANGADRPVSGQAVNVGPAVMIEGDPVQAAEEAELAELLALAPEPVESEQGMSRRAAELVATATVGRSKYLNGNPGQLYWSGWPDDHEQDDPDGGPFYERPEHAVMHLMQAVGYVVFPSSVTGGEPEVHRFIGR